MCPLPFWAKTFVRVLFWKSQWLPWLSSLASQDGATGGMRQPRCANGGVHEKYSTEYAVEPRASRLAWLLSRRLWTTSSAQMQGSWRRCTRWRRRSWSCTAPVAVARVWDHHPLFCAASTVAKKDPELNGWLAWRFVDSWSARRWKTFTGPSRLRRRARWSASFSTPGLLLCPRRNCLHRDERQFRDALHGNPSGGGGPRHGRASLRESGGAPGARDCAARAVRRQHQWRSMWRLFQPCMQREHQRRSPSHHGRWWCASHQLLQCSQPAWVLEYTQPAPAVTAAPVPVVKYIACASSRQWWIISRQCLLWLWGQFQLCSQRSVSGSVHRDTACRVLGASFRRACSSSVYGRVHFIILRGLWRQFNVYAVPAA